MKNILSILALTSLQLSALTVTSTQELVTAVQEASESDTIQLAEGTFTLTAPLELKKGMTLKGAGAQKTILTGSPSWKPSVTTLPDPETKTKGMDTKAYLIRLQNKAPDITISNLTLTGPHLHGAIYGFGNKNLHLHHLTISDFLWSGIRTFSMDGAKIHDCEFIDAGGRWERGGKPGLKGGITGGGIFAIWMKNSEISHNRFTRTQLGKADSYYGIKVRQAKRCHIHHNTIEVNFSMELPFENDEDNEISHNVCFGTISIPKHAGGAVPESGKTFHIHHNWFRDSYAIEFVRNGVEISHNLFDFDLSKDHGNSISGFGKAPAKGPASFHNNLVSNPGRGVIWLNEPFNQLEVRNNHIITRTTVTPRTEGLFGFNKDCDFSTIKIRDNIIECQGQPRKMFRNEASYQATVLNNHLINVPDSERFKNVISKEKVGPESPLSFQCGVHGEFTVLNWKASPSK